jgi:hypothetical protein
LNILAEEGDHTVQTVVAVEHRGGFHVPVAGTRVHRSLHTLHFYS